MTNRRPPGLDEIMIVNPSPVGARPCPFTPRVPGRSQTGRATGRRAPRTLIGPDGTVYRAVGRIVRPAYYQDPVSGSYQII